MGKIVISENVTLDGVVQDPTGEEGFRHGGWFVQVGSNDREGFYDSTSGANGPILRGWVPFRDGPAGGTAAAPPARYFFTVRQSQPTSAAISAYDAPASCKARNLRMFIQFSGCRIIEEITLRCSRLGSRRNEG